MRRVLAVLASVVLVVSCQDSNAPRSLARRIELSPLHSHTPGTAGLTRVFGADTFFRQKGKPFTETRKISTKGFKAPFVLTIQNGDALGGHRVSSGTVIVDGSTLLVPSDFNQQFPGIEAEIPAGDTVRLTVQLQSQPGSYLVITLEAQRAATRFCPPDVGDGFSFDDMALAVAAADTGGTILICDGLWDIPNVVVPKSLTFRPEHPSAATLRALPADISFQVNTDGAGGTVRFVDLAFLAQTGSISILSTGTKDTLVVDSSSFRGVANAAAVRTGVLSPTAMLVARNNQFVKFNNPILTQAGTLSILDNAIDSTTGLTPVGTTGTLAGSIERNRVHTCGVVNCISVVTGAGASGVLLKDNDLLTDWSTGTSTGINIIGQVDVVNNRVVGTGGGVGSTSSGTFYAFRLVGIRLNGFSGHPTATGNVIVNAFSGMNFDQLLTGASGRDNDISVVSRGISLNAGSTLLDFQRNDIRPLSQGFFMSAAPGVTSLNCNYWGRAIGPDNAGSFVPLALMNPFSPVPIANQPSIACTPASHPVAARFCPPDFAAGTGWSIIQNAMVNTVAGDTTWVCDGTYTIAGMGINRPITLIAEHAGLATLTTGGSGILSVLTVASGTTTIKDLNFVVPSGQIGINAGPSTAFGDSLVIDNNTFSSSFTTGNYVRMQTSTVPGAKVVIRNNTFTGKVNAVVLTKAPETSVLNNTFTGARSTGVLVSEGAYTLVKDNKLFDCSSCISAQGIGSQVFADITDNLIEQPAGPSSGSGVSVIATPTSVVNVLRNTINGTGPIADLSDVNTYPFQAGAISMSGTSTPANITVSNNVITRSGRGFNASSTGFTGSDNSLTTIHTGIRAGGASYSVHRNDFTSYVVAINFFVAAPAGSLTCNWWDSAAGPTSTTGPAAPASYTPFSVVPIANQPSVVCP